MLLVKRAALLTINNRLYYFTLFMAFTPFFHTISVHIKFKCVLKLNPDSVHFGPELQLACAVPALCTVRSRSIAHIFYIFFRFK